MSAALRRAAASAAARLASSKYASARICEHAGRACSCYTTRACGVATSQRAAPLVGPSLRRGGVLGALRQLQTAASELAPTKWQDQCVEEVTIGGSTFGYESGKLAKLADGSVLVRYGDTHVLVTVVVDPSYSRDRDFLPLQVEYREPAYAIGRIPNTFLRREGAPKDREVLCSRVIDRAVRPLFPKGFYYETQIVASVLCADALQDPDVLCINGASAALLTSGLPWAGPIGAVRIGRINGDFVVNPNTKQMEDSDLNLVYACTRDDAVMVEASAESLPESTIASAFKFAHSEATKLLEPQHALAASLGKPKREMKFFQVPDLISQRVEAYANDTVEQILMDGSLDKMHTSTIEAVRHIDVAETTAAVSALQSKVLRNNVLQNGVRCDGRQLQEIRDIQCEPDILPITLCTVTLGGLDDSLRSNALVGPPSKPFYVHYGFPPFSVNEVGKLGGVNRREIGHGMLAEKSLVAVMPSIDEFPFSIRLNSMVLASDGSSSMATVCGGSMALMNAGVPIKEHVAGISIGLVADMDPWTNKIQNYKLITDILGIEDHFGDMDYKVAGTRKGVTAIQLDVKLPGIPIEVLVEGMHNAQSARLRLLDQMEAAIARPEESFKDSAPRFGRISIDKEFLGRIIGPSGSNIKAMEAAYGAKLTVSEDGTVSIFAPSAELYASVKKRVEEVAGKELEVGEKYNVNVVAIKDYGAFVEFPSGRQALLHISELDHERLTVQCIGRDIRGNVRLSRKTLLPSSGGLREASSSLANGTVSSNESSEQQGRDAFNRADEPHSFARSFGQRLQSIGRNKDGAEQQSQQQSGESAQHAAHNPAEAAVGKQYAAVVKRVTRSSLVVGLRIEGRPVEGIVVTTPGLNVHGNYVGQELSLTCVEAAGARSKPRFQINKES
eukprot:jgi/Chlat1/8353/Chrsp80S07895